MKEIKEILSLSKKWFEDIDFTAEIDIPKEYQELSTDQRVLTALVHIINACPDDQEGLIEGEKVFVSRVSPQWCDGIDACHLWSRATKDRRDILVLRRTVQGAKKKEIVGQVVEYIKKRYSLITIDSKGRDMFVFQDGYYVPADNMIRQVVQNILVEEANESIKNEILNALKDWTRVIEEQVAPPKHLINLENGIYDLKKKGLIPHSDKYFFTWKLPTIYDSEARCPRILNLMKMVLTEDDITLIQEWMGYCLYRDYGFKKAMIFVGEQHTGKTTVLRLFQALVGRENMSGVSLDSLTASRFALAHLKDKHVNIYDDLSYKDVNDNGIFKMVTGNGMVTAEFKFGHQFTFQNYSKLTFSCNKIPSVKDTNDEAYFGRWIVVEFNRQLTNPDPSIFEKINTKEELSGLCNFALEGLERLIKNKQFSYHKTEDEIKEQMLKSGSPIAQFAYDCLEESVGSIETKDEMIECFWNYVKSKGLPISSKEDFGRKLPKYAPYVESCREGKRGSQVHVWRNVRIKNLYRELGDTQGFEDE